MRFTPSHLASLVLLASCYPAEQLSKGQSAQTDTAPDTAGGTSGGTGTGEAGTGTGASGTGSDGGSGAGAGGDDSTGSGEDGGSTGTAPTCSIERPVTDTEAPFDEPLALRATAADAEDGDLSSTIIWTSDVESGVLATGPESTVVFSRSGLHVIQCSVTDSDGNTANDSVRYTVVSPIVEIDRPRDGDTEDEDDRVRFEGTGEDLEDGELRDAALVWTSNIDGEIGTGREFRTRNLSVGDHVITLTGTDSDGETASTSIELEIEED